MWSLFRRRQDKERDKRDILLSAYLDGELAEAERESLERRLSQDPVLRAELRAMQRTVSLLHELPQVAAPRNFLVTESMVARNGPVSTARSARPEPEKRASAWAAPLLTAATAVVSLLFVVVLAGDLLMPSLGGLTSAPAPMLQHEEAPKFAFEAAPTQEAKADESGAVDLGSTPLPPRAAESGDADSVEAPEMAVEGEEVVDEPTGAPRVSGEGGATPLPAGGGGPTEETAALTVPTVAPTVTAVTRLTPTIPAEAPVVSEGELGLVEPALDQLDATPQVAREHRGTGPLGLAHVYWTVLEIVLGIASLALILATIRAWRLRHR